MIGPNWLRARDRVSNTSGIRFAHRVATRDRGVEYVAEIPSEYVRTGPGWHLPALVLFVFTGPCSRKANGSQLVTIGDTDGDYLLPGIFYGRQLLSTVQTLLMNNIVLLVL